MTDAVGRRPRDRRGRALPVVLLVVLLSGLLAGCSSIPTSGPVRKGRDLQLDRADAAVRVIGQPPPPGARPEDVVRGFLQAGADFVNDHSVARLYLAPVVRQKWRPGTGAAIYDRAEGAFSIDTATDGSVQLTAAQVAHIDGDGHYARTAPGTRLRRTFHMTRVDGEWRIAGLDDGLLLTRGDVDETYRQLNLYFAAPSKTVLVPDPVFLPALPGLSTALVTRLLRGPTGALRAAVTTGFPRGTTLAVSSVPVRDGVARVTLDAAALQADDRSRELMSAQLVWTLKQLAEVQVLRITADGEDLGVPGVGQQQSRDAWGAYDPAGLTQGAIAYVVRSGRVGRVVDGRFTPVPGPAGDGRVPVVRPAVALDASQLAAVSPDGRRLLVGRLVEEGTLAVRLRGQNLSAPSWDPTGSCWVVDRADGQVWMLPAGRETPVRVGVPQVGAGPISALRVARDGTRVAVVAGAGDAARLFTAAVLVGDPGGAVRLGPLREVLPALRSVRDVAWSDATTLAVLGRQGEDLVAPLFTDTDGYQIASVESQPGLSSIAAAPPLRPVLAGTDKGRLWQYTAGRGWVSLGPGADPAYPG